MKHLKIMTCGSVDDGKSTLLGRLIYETGNLNYDQSSYLEKLNQKYRNKPKNLDYSLLVDGLIDEKEQGITIDLAFKYLVLGDTQITLIDSPGHVEYTKNTACAASIANVALVLIDATKGITTQTRKHLEIINYFSNIKEVVVCINKLDKINYNQKKYNSLTAELNNIVNENNYKKPIFVPISALNGENIISNSKKMQDFNSTNLLSVIEGLKITKDKTKDQIGIVRHISVSDSKRIYLIESLSLAFGKNDLLFNIFTGEKSKVKEIYSGFKKIDSTRKFKNIAVELKDEISISIGDILAPVNLNKELTDSFKARIIWCSNSSLETSKSYVFQFANKEIQGFVSKINLNNISKNSILEATIELNQHNFLTDNLQEINNFLLIDPHTNESLGFGYCLYPLDRGKNVHFQSINPDSQTSLPCLWFTGLPASGKTTIASNLSKQLHKQKINNYVLDGDNLRKTINKDLGFSKSERIENNRRIAHIAKLLSEAGVLPIVATVSPIEEIRSMAKEIVGSQYFHLIYIEASIKECIKRNPKNLYDGNKKIKNITGVNSPFEIPKDADLTINTEQVNIEQSTNLLYTYLNDKTSAFTNKSM
tara:strand:+ start:1614 stop:3395 length:1782 start_codon:yes stop_codon:yes gene_type:complete